jgi:Flp pilus assembly pilin Flp
MPRESDSLGLPKVQVSEEIMLWVSQEDGQTSVEYGLVLALITAVLVLALVGVIGPATEFFNTLQDLITPG